ncbi:MAG: LysR family transcriptional regulator [Pseudomonadota bacterium]|nr:LysR family transcriptional regulator [Pseudomonadota bacterium]
MLDNLRVFIAAVEQQSLTGAALALGMTIATVSRRVQELELRLQCELFHRSNKGLRLTPAGQAYYDETASYIHEVELRLFNLDRSLNSLEGDLRVMAPLNIGRGPLDTFWQGFIRDNPSISLNIVLYDPDDDLLSHQFDIAISSGPQANSSLVQQSLGSITPILVVGPDTSFPLPTDIDELNECSSIAAHLFREWDLVNNGQEYRFCKNHRHVSNDMAITLNLVKAGAGVAMLPLSMVYHEVQSGELVRVLPEWAGKSRDVALLWPKQRSLSIRAQRFREALVLYLAQVPWFNALGR